MKGRVLIIDDKASARYTRQRTLEGQGYELDDAEDNPGLWSKRRNSVLRSSSLISLVLNPLAFGTFLGAEVFLGGKERF